MKNEIYFRRTQIVDLLFLVWRLRLVAKLLANEFWKGLSCAVSQMLQKAADIIYRVETTAIWFRCQRTDLIGLIFESEFARK